jgi:branched-chain amino acid transport system substrate-binding protein
MVHSSFHLSAAICMALAISAAPGAAQTAGGAVNLSGGKVKVGVLTDIAGPTAMANGKGSVIAAEMAAEDFGAGLNVEVISADHSGKPDIGSQIAARWFDVEGVDAIADMQGSPIGFAVQNMAVQKSKIMLLSGSTSSDFNGKACSPLTVQWTVDTYNLAVNGGVLPELTYRAAVEQFGAHGAAELSYLVGLYCLVSVTLNTFDVPVPD